MRRFLRVARHLALIVVAVGALGGADLDYKLAIAVELGQIDQTRILLAAGADPRAAKRPDGSPIVFAAVENPPLLKLLLEAGADPNACDNSSHAPLLAVAAQFGAQESVALLLQHGADRSAQDDHGFDAEDWADWYSRRSSAAGEASDSRDLVRELRTPARCIRAADSVAMPPADLRLQITTGHGSGPIYASVVSRDGNLIVTAGKDNAIRVWDRKRSAELRTLFGHAQPVRALDLSRTGLRLLSGSEDGTARLWDLTTGRELVRIAPGGKFDVRAVALSRDGTTAALLAENGQLEGWSLDTCERLWARDGRASSGTWKYDPWINDAPFARRLTFSDVGDRLMVRDLKRALFLDGLRGKELFVSTVDGVLPIAATLEPSGAGLVAMDGGKAALVDSTSGSRLRVIESPLSELTAATFSSKGDRLLLAGASREDSRKGFAVLLAWPTGAVLASTITGGGVPSVAEFSEDGSLVLLGGALFYETRDAEKLGLVTGEMVPEEPVVNISTVRFLPRSSCLLVTSDWGGVVALLDTHTGQICQQPMVSRVASVSSLAISDDDFAVASGSAALWSFAEGHPSLAIERSKASFAAAVAKLRGALVVGTERGGVSVRAVPSGKLVRSFSAHDCELTSLAVHGPEELLTAGGSLLRSECAEERVIRRWKTDKWKELPPLDESGERVTRLSVSPDNKWTGALYTDGTIRVWNQHGDLEGPFSGIAQPFSGVLALGSHDLLAVAQNRRLLLLELPAGRERSSLGDQNASITAAAFSRDSSLLVAGTRDGEIVIHRVSDAGVQQALRQEVPVTELALSNNWMVSGGEDGGVRLFALKDSASHVAVPRKALATAFTFLDGQWLVTDADGRFDTGDLEDLQAVHWFRRSEPLTPIPLESFMREYYEPGLLMRVMKGEKLEPVRSLSDLEIRQPEVKVTGVKREADTSGKPGDQVTVTVEVARPAGACKRDRKELPNEARDVQLFRDRQMVGYLNGAMPWGKKGRFGDQQVEVEASGTKARLRFHGIHLPRDGRKEVTFSAYAFNCDEVKSETAKTTYAVPSDLPRRRGRAYVITMGVNASESPEWKLRYAAADARKLREVLQQSFSRSGHFEVQDVVPIALVSDDAAQKPASDEAPATKRNLRAVLDLLAGRPVAEEVRRAISGAEHLEPARPEDLVLISFSSHGYRDPHGTFYLFPTDIGPGHGKDIEREGPSLLEHAISSTELETWLRDVDAGEFVMIVDACHSAASVQGEGYKPGPFGSRGLGQLAYSKGMRILAASQADALALEDQGLRQGLLTYALVQDGLESRLADLDHDGRITLGEWLRYGAERVPTLAEEVRSGHVVASTGRGWEIHQDPEAEAAAASGHLVQQPVLFDFAKRTADLAITVSGR